MSQNYLSIRQCAISLSFSSIIPFKLLHISYILNLKALFWSDIWSLWLSKVSICFPYRQTLDETDLSLSSQVCPSRQWICSKFPVIWEAGCEWSQWTRSFHIFKGWSLLNKAFFKILQHLMQEKSISHTHTRTKMSV